MKKLIILLALLSALGAPTATYAAPPAAPFCGRIVWRTNPTTLRGLYHYDVLVGTKLYHWTAPTRYTLGGRLCV